MNIGRIIAWFKFGRAVEGAVTKPGYDIGLTIRKGIVSFAKTSVAIAGPVLIAYWSDPEHIKAALEAIGPAGVAWAPVITMAITMLRNWAKHREKAE